MDTAILILVVMVLLGIGAMWLGFTVGVPGVVKEPPRPKLAPSVTVAESPRPGQLQQEAFARESQRAVATRALTPAGEPDDSPGLRLKVMAGVFSSAVIVLALGAYVVWEPGRAADAASRQLHENVLRGAKLFSTYCAVCHGPTGGGLVGPNLHLTDPGGLAQRNKLNPQDAADMTKLRELVVTTITEGRRGTVMPTWGQEFGGPLNQTQISNLADLITTNGWQYVVPTTPVAGAVGAPAAAGTPAAGAPAAPGAALLTKYGCVSCHTISTVPGAVGTIGPNLSHIASVPKIPESTGNLDNTPANLGKWIFNAPAVKPGVIMPNFSAQGMTQDELTQIVDYLETLK